MASKLWEAFERTAHKPDAAKDPCGSPVRLELRWEKDFSNTIDAILALREAGLPLVEAKHKIEELMETRYLRIDLPAVVDVDELVARIARAGATATVVAPAQAA